MHGPETSRRPEPSWRPESSWRRPKVRLKLRSELLLPDLLCQEDAREGLRGVVVGGEGLGGCREGGEGGREGALPPWFSDGLYRRLPIAIIAAHAEVEWGALLLPLLGPGAQVEARVGAVGAGHRDLGDLHPANIEVNRATIEV